MYTVITGQRQVGKSTMVKKIMENICRGTGGIRFGGFVTKKEGDRVHIYELGKPFVPSEENLVGAVTHGKKKGFSENFDRFALNLAESAKKADIIIMDEIGFLESDAEVFRRTVLELLDGTTPVLAVVRDKDTPFLNRIRNHPDCQSFYVTEDNREQLAGEIEKFIEIMLKKKGLSS